MQSIATSKPWIRKEIVVIRFNKLNSKAKPLIRVNISVNAKQNRKCITALLFLSRRIEGMIDKGTKTHAKLQRSLLCQFLIKELYTDWGNKTI